MGQARLGRKGSEEMKIAKDCPFCGEDIGPVVARQGTKYTFYQVMHQPNKKGHRHGLIIMDVDEWNTRPIEDELRARIAELEEEIDQLTSHSNIERQDDKSPNDTQTQTIVYGKEREE